MQKFHRLLTFTQYLSFIQDNMIPLPQKITYKKLNENCGKIEIEPLYPGYGTTLGNDLRRVLLSSLEGAAITEFKIKGVAHEFMTIDGVLEDVIQIMQNLKKLRFKIFTEEPQTISLKQKGEKEILGKDFQIPPQLELVNPETHIATLTSKDAVLEMEAKVEKGIGYLPREERQSDEIGKILVDAIFSPVKKVGIFIENVRVGKRTDFEKLILQIETDGTISPKEAFLKSCEILLNHYSFFKENLKEDEKKET